MIKNYVPLLFETISPLFYRSAEMSLKQIRQNLSHRIHIEMIFNLISYFVVVPDIVVIVLMCIPIPFTCMHI